MSAFLNAELERLGCIKLNVRIDEVLSVLDTLALGAELHPGQRVGLGLVQDATKSTTRTGLPARALDRSFWPRFTLAMTGGQVDLSSESAAISGPNEEGDIVIRHQPQAN